MNENPYQPPALGETAESSTPSRPKMSAEELNRLQWEIKKQANNSIVAGALGIVFWIFVPMALISARRAMALSEEHNVGHQYLRRARRGKSLGFAGLILGGAIILGFLGLVLLSIVIQRWR